MLGDFWDMKRKFLTARGYSVLHYSLLRYSVLRYSLLRCSVLLLTAISTAFVHYASPFTVVAETDATLKPQAVAAASDTRSPIDEVKNTVDEVVKIVESLPGKENLSKRRAELRTLIEPRFDFREMAKRSLGAHWQKCSDVERQEFVDVFSDLLAKTYLARIEHARSNMITVDTEDIRDGTALVKTTVTYKGDTFPLDYKLVNRDNHWRVYDVIIENIGLVSNYRTEFAGIIRKDKFSGLMDKLRTKVKDAHAKETAEG